MTSGRTLRRWLGEFGVIVLGVAAALAAENWRETRVDRALAEDYLGRLQAELEEGAPTLRSHQARVDSAIIALDILLGRETLGTALSPEDSVSLILQGANYPFNPAGVILDLTYREMLATGSLNHVHDSALRDAISLYYRAAYRLGDVLLEQRAAGVRAWADFVSASTAGEARDWRADPSLKDAAARERLLSGLRAADSGHNLRVTRAGLSSIRRFLEPVVAGTDNLLALLE